MLVALGHNGHETYQLEDVRGIGDRIDKTRCDEKSNPTKVDILVRPPTLAWKSEHSGNLVRINL